MVLRPWGDSGYYVEVCSWVGRHRTLGQPIAEYLTQPLANLPGNVEGASVFDFAH